MQMRNILTIQFVLIVVCAAITYYLQGERAVLPALYGGAIALANTFLLSRRMGKVGGDANFDPKRSMMLLYLSAVGRFVFVLVALVIGLGVLKLTAIPLVGSFIVTQLGYAFALGPSRKAEQA